MKKTKELIRAVKRRETVKKEMKKGNVTVFERTTYGNRLDGTLSSNVIMDREFQIFQGIFDEYPLALRANQKAVRLESKPLFDFWKDNMNDQHYTLTGEQVAEKFGEWIKTKKVEWLEYYGTQQCAFAFIGEKDGLGSVNETAQGAILIQEYLRPVFLNHLKSVAQ